MPDLIKYSEGVFIEVAQPANRTQAVSNAAATRLKENFADAVKTVDLIIAPIADAITRVGRSIKLTEAEVEIGLAFSAEGNLFVTKASAEANLTIRLKLVSGGHGP